MSTFIENIENKIEILNKLKDQFIDSTEIYYSNPNQRGKSIVHINPTTRKWGKSLENHSYYQSQLRSEYQEFLEYFGLVKSLFSNSIQKSLDKDIEIIRRWIEKVKNAPGNDKVSAKTNFSAILNKFPLALRQLQKPDCKAQSIYIPDTNCLIRNPQIESYNWENYKQLNLIILPTVVSELDSLKINHKNEDVRKKANSVIKRFKGFRKQGNILDGVKINKNIYLKFEAREPKFNNSLSWLDPMNNDDRLIMSILEIQIANLFDNITLLSTDLNIQNKAALAGINYIDISDKLNI